jgi:GT2 family glycosyltransferase
MHPNGGEMSEPKALAEGPGEPGLVSVVIPTYNRAYILGEAIDSALRQTYRPLEVIVVDDGSQDETRTLVEAYGDPVRYFWQPNAGVSAARNVGMMHARGEFVALLDSDDRWLPWKLSAQVALLRRHPTVGMVWTDMSAVDEAGKLLHETFIRRMYSAHRSVSIEEVCARIDQLDQLCPEGKSEAGTGACYGGDVFPYMLLGSLVHTSTVLFRRGRLRLTGGFDETIRGLGEDYDFHLRTCSHGPVAFIDAPSIVYRVAASDALTAPQRYAVHLQRAALNSVLHWLERDRARVTLSRATIQSRLATLYGDLGEAELNAGDRRSARGHLWRSLSLRPGLGRRAMLWLLTLLPPPWLRLARSAKRKIRGE